MTAASRIRGTIRRLTLIVPSTYLYDGFAQTRAREEYPDKAKKLRESGGFRQSTHKETIYRPSKETEANELLESALGSTLLEQICNTLKEAGRSFELLMRAWSADGVGGFCCVPFFDGSPCDLGRKGYSNISGLRRTLDTIHHIVEHETTVWTPPPPGTKLRPLPLRQTCSRWSPVKGRFRWHGEVLRDRLLTDTLVMILNSGMEVHKVDAHVSVTLLGEAFKRSAKVREGFQNVRALSLSVSDAHKLDCLKEEPWQLPFSSCQTAFSSIEELNLSSDVLAPCMSTDHHLCNAVVRFLPPGKLQRLTLANFDLDSELYCHMIDKFRDVLRSLQLRRLWARPETRWHPEGPGCTWKAVLGHVAKITDLEYLEIDELKESYRSGYSLVGEWLEPDNPEGLVNTLDTDGDVFNDHLVWSSQAAVQAGLAAVSHQYFV
ncbi:hypothetical protein LTR86_003838 [Recurvomyces mirabilis]|nr:hypothetical protein LTR86_003838 [Recurvomyces mirabilis]